MLQIHSIHLKISQYPFEKKIIQSPFSNKKCCQKCVQCTSALLYFYYYPFGVYNSDKEKKVNLLVLISIYRENQSQYVGWFCSPTETKSDRQWQWIALHRIASHTEFYFTKNHLLAQLSESHDFWKALKWIRVIGPWNAA